MFTLDEDFIDAKFHLWAAQFGNIGLAQIVDLQNPMESTPNALDLNLLDEDEALFQERLTGVRSSRAWDVFKSFQPQLKTDGLRNATEEEFEREFLGI